MELLIKENYKSGSHIKLTRKQTLVRNQIQDKIDNGVYRLVGRPCLCGESDDSIIAETDRYGLNLHTVICKRCGLLRINPRLDNTSLEEFYKNEYRDLYMGPEYKDMNKYFADMIERGREIVNIVKNRSQLDLRDLNVLEIGCSAGGILVPFLESGASVKGFDYDGRYLDYGNEYNSALNLQLGGIESLENEKNKYDLILINHVLEHLSDPEYALRLIHGSLRTNGLLYVSVPGLKNPRYYFSPRKSFLGALHIAHLYHFTEASLIQLLHDFKAIYIDSEIRSLFHVNKTMETNKNNSVTSEHDDNIAFILQHEKSLRRKMWGLKSFLMNLLNRHLH